EGIAPGTFDRERREPTIRPEAPDHRRKRRIGDLDLAAPRRLYQANPGITFGRLSYPESARPARQPQGVGASLRKLDDLLAHESEVWAAAQLADLQHDGCQQDRSRSEEQPDRKRRRVHDTSWTGRAVAIIRRRSGSRQAGWRILASSRT